MARLIKFPEPIDVILEGEAAVLEESSREVAVTYLIAVLVMLIGLMAKNGILLVEFADQLRDRGYPLIEAITEGSKVRFRPVAMTLMSTVLGGLPLILGSGAGIEARESIGWVIFGGLGIAAIFTLFLTPALYLLIARFSKPRVHEEERMNRELAEAESLSS